MGLVIPGSVYAVVLLAGSASGSMPVYQHAMQEAMQAFAAHDAQAALRHLDRALGARPDGPEAHMLLSQVYLGLGRHEQAAETLKRLRTISGADTPRGIDAATLQAYALAQDERHAEALVILNEVRSLADDRPMLHLLLGKIQLELGQNQAASSAFLRAIGLLEGGATRTSTHPPGPLAAAYEGRGIAAYRSGDDAGAAEALARARGSINARYHLGLTHARGGRHEDAVTLFREILAEQPDHRGAHLGLARSASALSLTAEAEAAFAAVDRLYKEEERRKSVKIRAGDLQTRAARHIARGEFADAAASLEQAARLVPEEELDTLFEIASLQHEAGDLEGSAETYRRISTQQPFSAEAHFVLGQVQDDRGDHEAAAASFRRAARLAPTRLQYRLQLADAYLRLNRIEEGVRELRFARNLKTDDPEQAYSIGIALARAGALREAAVQLETAIQLGHEGPHVRQVLSEIYADLGEPGKGAGEAPVTGKAPADLPPPGSR